MSRAAELRSIIAGFFVALLCFVAVLEFEAHVSVFTPVAGINRIVVVKHEHKLELYRGTELAGIRP